MLGVRENENVLQFSAVHCPRNGAGLRPGCFATLATTTHNPQTEVRHHLLLLTGGFPEGATEPFLEDEIAYLCETFEKVHIVYPPRDGRPRPVPKNCLLVKRPPGRSRIGGLGCGPYWLDTSALGLVLMKSQHPTLRTLARAHGWDVYFERHPHGYRVKLRFVGINLRPTPHLQSVHAFAARHPGLLDIPIKCTSRHGRPMLPKQ